MKSNYRNYKKISHRRKKHKKTHNVNLSYKSIRQLLSHRNGTKIEDLKVRKKEGKSIDGLLSWKNVPLESRHVEKRTEFGRKIRHYMDLAAEKVSGHNFRKTFSPFKRTSLTESYTHTKPKVPQIVKTIYYGIEERIRHVSEYIEKYSRSKNVLPSFSLNDVYLRYKKTIAFTLTATIFAVMIYGARIGCSNLGYSGNGNVILASRAGLTKKDIKVSKYSTSATFPRMKKFKKISNMKELPLSGPTFKRFPFPSKIDYIFTKGIEIFKHYITKDGDSDHYPIHVEV